MPRLRSLTCALLVFCLRYYLNLSVNYISPSPQHTLIASTERFPCWWWWRLEMWNVMSSWDTKLKVSRECLDSSQDHLRMSFCFERGIELFWQVHSQKRTSEMLRASATQTEQRSLARVKLWMLNIELKERLTSNVTENVDFKIIYYQFFCFFFILAAFYILIFHHQLRKNIWIFAFWLIFNLLMQHNKSAFIISL